MNLIKRGWLISKTLIFRLLISRAGGIISNPNRAVDLANGALKKLKKYDEAEDFVADIVAGVYIFTALIKDWAKGAYPGLERKKMILIFSAFIYFISPLDVIPDYIPILGLLDDLSLLAWLINTLQDEMNLYLAWRNGDDVPALAELTYDELYAKAQEVDLRGRSSMTKQELVEKLSTMIRSVN